MNVVFLAMLSTGLLQGGHHSRKHTLHDKIKRQIARKLADAANESHSENGRFDLADSPAQSFTVAGLRRKGYCSEDRYAVSQALPHTVGLDMTSMRVYAKAHNERT